MTKRKHSRYNCRSCGTILTIERLIAPKLGIDYFEVCCSCLVSAFEEVLREHKIICVSDKPPTTTAVATAEEGT